MACSYCKKPVVPKPDKTTFCCAKKALLGSLKYKREFLDLNLSYKSILTRLLNCMVAGYDWLVYLEYPIQLLQLESWCRETDSIICSVQVHLKDEQQLLVELAPSVQFQIKLTFTINKLQVLHRHMFSVVSTSSLHDPTYCIKSEDLLLKKTIRVLFSRL